MFIALNIMFLLKIYLLGGILATISGFISKAIFGVKTIPLSAWVFLFLLSYVGLAYILYYIVLELRDNKGWW